MLPDEQDKKMIDKSPHSKRKIAIIKASICMIAQ